jgi:AraC-like DNA-binding protein
MNSRLNEITDWPARAEAARYKLSVMARSCGVGLRQLQRFFQRMMGEAPKQWVNKLRLQKAVPLLAAGQSVKQVADVSGYAHAQHFSIAFKKFHGRPPSSVRAKTCLSPGKSPFGTSTSSFGTPSSFPNATNGAVIGLNQKPEGTHDTCNVETG